jgi:hypothetical protein
MVPESRDTFQIVVLNHLALMLVKVVFVSSFKTLARCPTKVSHSWAVMGHRDILIASGEPELISLRPVKSFGSGFQNPGPNNLSKPIHEPIPTDG